MHPFLSFARFQRPALLLASTLSLVLGLTCTTLAQNQTVTGNMNVGGELSVTGDADLHGNTLNFGTWGDNATQYGVRHSYAEDATTHDATLTLDGTRTAMTWMWQHPLSYQDNGQTVNVQAPQMMLDANNVLSLYDNVLDPSYVASFIRLDPGGTSYFYRSVAMHGGDNTMPGQQITGSSSVLTVALADARYLVQQSSGDRLILGTGATAAGNEAMAVGYHASASGQASTGVGKQAIATGLGATAFGLTATATATYATALGAGAHSTGEWSTAISLGSSAGGTHAAALGVFSQANGEYSTALGNDAQANSSFSTAIGNQVVASGDWSLVVGRLSNASGFASTVVGAFANATGWQSAAYGGFSTANGAQSTALGVTSGTAGTGSTALGFNSSAGGNYAVALGSYAAASGSYATALTSSAAAQGDYSVAAGRTQATSAYQTVVGSYALPGGDAHNWVATDDLFTVGNGQTPAAPSNAFAVKKNGDTKVSGTLTVVKAIMVQPQGDLSMGGFTAQPSPTP